MRVIQFDPIDSLFFREAKPFGIGEGGFLDSLFPPSAQTLSGAIRTAIGNTEKIDWQDSTKVKDLLGTAEDPGSLSFKGPYLYKDGQRLYPVPQNLLYSETESAWTRLIPKDVYQSDLGECRLPKAQNTLKKAKNIEQGWLDEAGLRAVLNGQLPQHYYRSEQLFKHEARVGIGRNNQTSSVEPGQLFFTRHIRLRKGISMAMALDGPVMIESGAIRLGGEGRLAHISQSDVSLSVPKLTSDDSHSGQLLIILLTHADLGGNTMPDWSQFSTSLECISACIGKPVREGGWDYAKSKPKPLRSLVPAGSCYFIETKQRQALIKELQDTHLGYRTKFGYGEIAVGLWKENGES